MYRYIYEDICINMHRYIIYIYNMWQLEKTKQPNYEIILILSLFTLFRELWKVASGTISYTLHFTISNIQLSFIL